MLELKASRFFQAALQSGLIDEAGLAACFELIPPEKRTPDAIDRRLARQAVGTHGAAPLTLAPAVIARLQRHAWPGNVRELRNVIERAALLAGSGSIQPAHLVKSQERLKKRLRRSRVSST